MTPFFVSTTVDVFTSPLPVPSTTSRICTAAYAGSQDQKLKLQPFVGWTCLWFAVCGNLQTLAACRQTLLGWSSWVRSSWRAKMTCINLDRLLCQILPRSLHVHRCLAVAAQGAKHKIWHVRARISVQKAPSFHAPSGRPTRRSLLWALQQRKACLLRACRPQACPCWQQQLSLTIATFEKAEWTAEGWCVQLYASRDTCCAYADVALT